MIIPVILACYNDYCIHSHQSQLQSQTVSLDASDASSEVAASQVENGTAFLNLQLEF